MSVDTALLLDIIDLIDRIQKQAGPLGREAFLESSDALDTTAYRLLHIGEASKNLSDGVKAKYPQIPWIDIVGMRNLLAHEYFIRESTTIWTTVAEGLGSLRAVCGQELDLQGFTVA